MDIQPRSHVLVIDGRKLLLFRNDGGIADPSLTLITHCGEPSAPTHDQGTGPPGKTHARFGEARSGYEQTDFHQQDEDRLAAAAADMLAREVLGGRIETLIIAAAPRTLGELRKHYHAEVQKRVAGEIAKDFAGRSSDEITSLIAKS